MMKKKLLMLGLVAACTSTMAFACPDGKCPPPPCRPCGPDAGFHRPCCPPPPMHNLDEKLKLTTAQKEKAKALRMETREQMRPIMEAIKTKHEQKEIIKHNRNMTATAQCEQVAKLNAEISELEKQAHDLRIKNEKDFESILTQKQKNEFNKLKQQQRKQMAKNFKKGAPQPPRR